MNFKNIISYLTELSQNNNREWFNANKDRFLQVKKEFDQIVEQLIPKIHSIDPGIGAVEAKDCVFRIYRDVRFSKDKNPYKIHFGAYISKDGRKSKKAGYYLHIQPGSAFLAAGAYMPEPEILKEIRYEIVEKIDDLNKIIEAKNFKKYFPRLDGEKLKTIPKGFPKDFKNTELLKLKSFEIAHMINEEILYSPTIQEYLLQLVKIAYPFNCFMNKVIESSIE
jgi:uncharacterized protein (TIGR02453 family)